MTREQAVKWVKFVHDVLYEDKDEEIREALNMAIEALSAEAVPQIDQYKKGFEDAKRAFLVEYARESENMRKRIAQLEVMLNAQKAISAEAVRGWIPLSHDDNGLGTDFPYERDGEWVIVTDGKSISVERIKKDAYDHFFPNGRWFELEDVIAWMPMPEPYKEDNDG